MTRIAPAGPSRIIWAVTLRRDAESPPIRGHERGAAQMALGLVFVAILGLFRPVFYPISQVPVPAF